MIAGSESLAQIDQFLQQIASLGLLQKVIQGFAGLPSVPFTRAR